jgi:hypothetical protein
MLEEPEEPAIHLPRHQDEKSLRWGPNVTWILFQPGSGFSGEFKIRGGVNIHKRITMGINVSKH